MTDDSIPVGLALGSHLAPEQICGAASLGEELGFGELWVLEDYWFTGAIAGATAALAATQRIPIGTGIVSAMVRHPSVLAMEVSTIARMFPGRFWPGVGLGLPTWLGQMGLEPQSHLAAMRECVTSVRRLLAGETLTEDGRVFQFDGIKLNYPLDENVPVYAGVMAPKMLALSGECADGTVGSVLASHEYVSWARSRIAEGQARAGRDDHHRLAVFAIFSMAADAHSARDAIRPTTSWYLATMPNSPLFEQYGIREELVAMAAGGPDQVAREMPDRWLDDLTVVGTPENCAMSITRLLDAGADSVILYPAPAERTEELIRLAGERLLPLFR